MYPERRRGNSLCEDTLESTKVTSIINKKNNEKDEKVAKLVNSLDDDW